jgi:hypothetical protein
VGVATMPTSATCRWLMLPGLAMAMMSQHRV